jgi:hypothetical protein
MALKPLVAGHMISRFKTFENVRSFGDKTEGLAAGK